MVQSPFRYKKPPSNNSPLFSNGPNPKQRTTIWIGGDTTFVGEGSSSIAKTFRNMLNPNAGSSRKSLVKSENDVEAAQEDVGVDSTATSTDDDDDDGSDKKELGSSRGSCAKIPRRKRDDGSSNLLPTNANNGNGSSTTTTRSMMRSIRNLSPKRRQVENDNDGDDVFLSPIPFVDDAPLRQSKRERPMSVWIGGKTIIGESSMPVAASSSSYLTSGSNNDAKGRNSSRRGNTGTDSLKGPARALTMSYSLGSNRVKDIEEIQSNQEATSPRHDEDEHDDQIGWKYNNHPPIDREIAVLSPCDVSVGTKRKSAIIASRHSTRSKGLSRGGITTEGGKFHCHNHQHLHTADGIKRRRLSKRARTRLTTREVNSHVQPGRHYSSMESLARFEKRKAISLPRTIDFFRRVEIKLIGVNVLISVLLTAFVLFVCPEPWQRGLRDSSLAVSVLGAFLSFALVFRTQSCYARWWEARTMWGKMTSACINLSGQARTWFGDEDLVDKFLTQCVVFPYACKANLRGNQLTDSSEEGPRFLHSGMLTDADLGVIIRHGKPPFVCLEIMRRTMYEALAESNGCQLPSTMHNGAFLAMEQVLWELYMNFGACRKINSTRMPASYTVFMRSFVVFFFGFASLTWPPTIKWLTPIITGFMVFLINTVIVVGDQMMRPFDLQWAGLPLQKYCVVMEHEIMNVSRRHADINCLFSA
ncbi:hypothetical protein ACHAXR_005852 [Thalassiosira sp. AJA248-18]